ncbi:MAG: MASE1 domain-containing protein, partial [Actinobacteria bacterium]|nr:MASE1 domain-containing protein [Actinomycetota bacterium]
MRARSGRRFDLGYSLSVLLLAGVYYGAARLSLHYALIKPSVTPVWPPTGIAVVGLFLLGSRAWPGIALGAFLANAGISPNIAVAVMIAAGNTLAPLASYILLRACDFRPDLGRLRDASVLVFLGALAAMSVSASIGTTALWVSHAIGPNGYVAAWSVWWTGDAFGVLVFVPFLFVFPTVPRGLSWSARAEGTFVVAAAGAVTYAVTRSDLSLMFVVLPVTIYASMRFKQKGAAPAVAVVTLVAVSAAVSGLGPFSHRSLFQRMLTLQAFNGTVVLTSFLLAALRT